MSISKIQKMTQLIFKDKNGMILYFHDLLGEPLLSIQKGFKGDPYTFQFDGKKEAAVFLSELNKLVSYGN